MAGYLLRKWCAERRVEGPEDPSEVRSLRVSALKESEDDQWSVVESAAGGQEEPEETEFPKDFQTRTLGSNLTRRRTLAHTAEVGGGTKVVIENSGLREPLAHENSGLREPLAHEDSGLRESLAHEGKERKKDKWIIDDDRSVLIRLHSCSRLYLLDPRKLKLPDQCQVSQLSGRGAPSSSIWMSLFLRVRSSMMTLAALDPRS